jgi:Na+/H+-dicarboxylate symporter
MKKIALHWQVIIALVLGVVYAAFAVTNNWNSFTINYIAPFGDIFIRILKLIAAPLVLFSIISGVTSLGSIKDIGKLGGKTLLIYLGTTLSAVAVGLLLVNAIAPGNAVDEEARQERRIEYEIWANQNAIKRLDSIDLLNDPTLVAKVEEVKKRTESSTVDEDVQDKLRKAQEQKGLSPLYPLVDVVPSNIIVALADMKMLQVIFFAVFFGIVLVMIPSDKAGPVIGLVDGFNEVFVMMVNMVMKTMPFFVFALMAGTLVKTAGDNMGVFMDQLEFLGVYSITVLIGLFIMAFIFYPTLASLFAGKNFMTFIRNMGNAQLTAFSTSSSVATLPVTMDTVHNKHGVSEGTTSFVLPIGATVNMDGTSLYQAVAVVAMAQLHMVDLSLGQQLTIVITATMASIGAAAVPSAGLVLMIVVLESVGLNPAWIAIVLPVDRILDMCRTVVNVTGDATVSVLVDPKE